MAPVELLYSLLLIAHVFCHSLLNCFFGGGGGEWHVAPCGVDRSPMKFEPKKSRDETVTFYFVFVWGNNTRVLVFFWNMLKTSITLGISFTPPSNPKPIFFTPKYIIVT